MNAALIKLASKRVYNLCVVMPDYVPAPKAWAASRDLFARQWPIFPAFMGKIPEANLGPGSVFGHGGRCFRQDVVAEEFVEQMSR